MSTTVKKGTVTAFNESTGWGEVATRDGQTMEFGATSFRSGRPARYPAEGDAVDVVVSESGLAVSVRLERPR